MDFSTFGKFTYTRSSQPSAAWHTTPQALQAKDGDPLQKTRGLCRGVITFSVSEHLERIPKPNEYPNFLNDLISAAFKQSPAEGVKWRNKERSDEMFNKAFMLVEMIEQRINDGNNELVTRLTATIVESLTLSIYSSNYIEQIGLDLQETSTICQGIFSEYEVGADERIPFDEEACEKHHLPSVIGEPLPLLSNRDRIIRARREVIQHAKALQYLFTTYIIRKATLSESIILETHRIIVSGVENHHHDGSTTPSHLYGGRYRAIPVHAGNNNFAVPQHVPKMVARMVEKFNKEEGDGVEDSFELAGRLQDELVMIHPFEDGNGRLSRLVGNAVLMKYVGVTVEIGGSDEERKEYLGIMKRSGDEMAGAEELCGMVKKKAVERLEVVWRTVSGFQ